MDDRFWKLMQTCADNGTLGLFGVVAFAVWLINKLADRNFSNTIEMQRREIEELKRSQP